MPAWWDREDMPSVEERLAYLEGRVGDHVGAITDIRTDIRALRGEITDLRAETHNGFETLRSTMETRFAGIDHRSESMDAKISRLIGIQIGILLMIASAALASFFK